MKEYTATFLGLKESDKLTCTICGESDWPLGRWAFTRDGFSNPVCRGACWQKYTEKRKALLAQEFLEMLCPELVDGSTQTRG